MNFTSLLLHGFSAMSVFGDFIGVRLLFFAATLVVLAIFFLGVVAVMKFFTDMPIPGWATTAGGILTLVPLQAILLLVITVFTVLGNRRQARFIPIRDAALYIEAVEEIAPTSVASSIPDMNSTSATTAS